MSKYGKELQDMGADAFRGIAVRGVRGSEATHKNLKQMHKTEISYENEKALENEINSNFKGYVNEIFEEVKPLIGKSYYKISKDDMDEFVKTTSEVIYAAAEENITILQAPELNEQIDELEKQLVDKGKALEQVRDLESKNKALLKEKSDLEELSEALKDKDIVISQQTEIDKLKQSLEQKDAMITKLENQALASEEVVNQAKASKDELVRLKNIETQKTNIMTQKERIEKEKAELETQIKIHKEQADKVEVLNKKREKTLYKLKNATKVNRAMQKEKQELEEENKRLKEENALLKAFKDKIVNFFKSVANKIPAIKEFIYDNAPEIKGEVFERRDMGIDID